MVGGFKSVKEIAEEWKLTTRTVRSMCANGGLEGARKLGRDWIIPSNVERPVDWRVVSGKYRNWRKRGDNNGTNKMSGM